MALPGASVDVTDDDGAHFAATVISSAFEGLPLLDRHRKVYAALGELMHGLIHALALVTQTPTEKS